MYWTNNPVMDDMRYQESLENRPHIECENCGNPIYKGEEYIGIKNECYCLKCILTDFKETYQEDI